MSSVMQAEINLPFITADASGPKHLVLSLTRAKLEQLTGDLIEKTTGPLKQVYEKQLDGEITSVEAGIEEARRLIS